MNNAVGDGGKIEIARVGKTYGVKGELKLLLLSDFPEQFKKGASFAYDEGELYIERFDSEQGIVKFRGFDAPETAKALTSKSLYTTQEETRKSCKLKAGEFFWFDIIGSKVVESGELLGVVDSIDRFGGNDHLTILTEQELVSKSLPKSFVLPYTDRYIKSVDVSGKIINAEFAKEILEAS